MPIFQASDLDGAADLYGEDMPAPSDYLNRRQKDGKPQDNIMEALLSGRKGW